ncbi:MAG: ABC transporter substrate-binding protein [Clostridium baratii]|uniref:ABC transporter substrate-binding protein n=1 Tax=Clostridium baratii TaxID=1561 RepID=UPI00242B4967|nr:ABC transporter substrate-binding protein [Clostridium baratii]MBS6041113.1 ABC transporter substrate-binding protein [Clostridium baratii]
MKHILNKKLLLLLPLVILLALLFYIYPSKTKVKYPNLKGKHLTAYVALREQEAKALLEKFKKETGCTYEYIKLPTEEAVKRILAESENPSGDIFIGGTCDAYELLKANGALAKYESPNAKKIPSEYKDSSNYWTGFKIDTLAIGINKEVWDKEFKPKGIKLPTDFDDLLKKEFKNKIIIPSPETSGTGYTFLASLYQKLGEKSYKDFLDKFSNNVSSYTVSGFNSIQRVSSGEYAITVNFLGDQLLESKINPNIISITPKNTGWNVDSVAEIKNSSNKEVAEAFIDFILSDDIANSLSTYSNSISTKRSNDITNNIYQDYSFKDAATERNTIMKMFNDSNSK